MQTLYQPHIALSPAMTKARYAILPGDPKRLDHIKTWLTEPQELAFNREYRSLKGDYQGVEILALSTGIGGASTAIALHELHHLGITAVIRIGSCGALQADIALGELILASGAVRDEGTSKAYLDTAYPAISDPTLLQRLQQHSDRLHLPARTGIIRSHDSFYTDRENEICSYWSARGILGADMETAALFVIGTQLQMRTASILNVVVRYQEQAKQAITNYQQQQQACYQGERNEIILALTTLADLAKCDKPNQD